MRQTRPILGCGVGSCLSIAVVGMWATSLSRKYFATEQDIAAIPPVAGTGVDLTNPTGLVGVDRTNRPLEPLTATEVNFIYARIFQGQRYVDWLDPTTARVDRSELKVHSRPDEVSEVGQ